MMSSVGNDRGARVIASYWIQACFTIVIIILRFWSRKLTNAIGWDDWLMLWTLIMFITLASLITHSALIGGFRHLYSLDQYQQQEVVRWNYIYQVWAIWTTTPGKASVAVTIYRLMMPLRGWRFWTLVFWISLLAMINTSNCVLTYVQCDPPEALWDRTIEGARCWSPNVQTAYAMTTSSVNVFVDIVLATLPATIIWNLQMETKKKIGLAVLLGLGICAAIVGCVKTAYLAQLGRRSDLTWNVYDLVLLAGAEIFLIIVCGSIPTLKPLWTRYISDGNWKTTLERLRGRATPLSEAEMQSYDVKSSSNSLDRSSRSSDAYSPERYLSV